MTAVSQSSKVNAAEADRAFKFARRQFSASNTFGAIWLGDCDSLQRNVFSLSILGFHPSYICLWPPSLLSIVHAIVLWSGQQPRNSAPLPPFLRESPQSDLAAAISKRRRSLNSTLRHLLIFFDISASGFCSYANILDWVSLIFCFPHLRRSLGLHTTNPFALEPMKPLAGWRGFASKPEV